jgi:hypothetical protein
MQAKYFETFFERHGSSCQVEIITSDLSLSLSLSFLLLVCEHIIIAVFVSL